MNSNNIIRSIKADIGFFRTKSKEIYFEKYESYLKLIPFKQSSKGFRITLYSTDHTRILVTNLSFEDRFKPCLIDIFDFNSFTLERSSPGLKFPLVAIIY